MTISNRDCAAKSNKKARNEVIPLIAENPAAGNHAITAAATAMHKARRSAVILGFSTAASLLFGAAAAWYAACEGGRHRDEVNPPLTWRW